jgi:hypothetical protein
MDRSLTPAQRARDERLARLLPQKLGLVGMSGCVRPHSIDCREPFDLDCPLPSVLIEHLAHGQRLVACSAPSCVEGLPALVRAAASRRSN